jgi:hypothetical protein
MAKDVRIDHMALDLPGVSAAGMRRIAMMVAEGLSAAGGLPQSVEAPRLSVTIDPGAVRDEAAWARLIIAATLRDLARTT